MNLIKPKFWSKNNIIVYLLWPLTIITRIITGLKNNKKKYHSKIKTICVGNIYLGGTGKTQLVIKLNELLKKKYKITLVKKKYQNQIDEQTLLKKNMNVILPDNRVEGLKRVENSRTAQNTKKNLAIFDDGLQDKSLKYSISMVCFSSITGVGNGKLLPAGPLREDLSELKNYDAVFINGKKNKNLSDIIRNYNNKIKIFYGKYILKNENKFEPREKYLAFCGIGTPENFFNLLKENKINVKEKLVFPDHFDYNLTDINKIKKYALKQNLQIVTTEKDFMKIKKFKNHNIVYTSVDLQIEKVEKLKKFLFNKL